MCEGREGGREGNREGTMCACACMCVCVHVCMCDGGGGLIMEERGKAEKNSHMESEYDAFQGIPYVFT